MAEMINLSDTDVKIAIINVLNVLKNGTHKCN
jgi:hypothetical protein